MLGHGAHITNLLEQNDRVQTQYRLSHTHCVDWYDRVKLCNSLAIALKDCWTFWYIHRNYFYTAHCSLKIPVKNFTYSLHSLLSPATHCTSRLKHFLHDHWIARCAFWTWRHPSSTMFKLHNMAKTLLHTVTYPFHGLVRAASNWANCIKMFTQLLNSLSCTLNHGAQSRNIVEKYTTILNPLFFIENLLHSLVPPTRNCKWF